MPTVLILSTTTGYQLRSFNEAAERLGVTLVFATDACHQLDDPWQDRAIPVRFHEEASSLEAIVTEARLRPIDAVIAVGDRPVTLAARAAEALGLPGNSPAAAAASINKGLARARFAAAGLPVPPFVDLAAAAADVTAFDVPPFPVVVKPLGLSGSRGVIRADTPDELTAAIVRVRALLARPDIRALRTGLDDRLIIERFIVGKELAIEGVLTRGRLQTFAIFDKPDPLDGPFFEETIYLTPSAMPDPVQRAVSDQVGQATVALGLVHGPVHAECRVGPGGIVMLEVASRPIGGLCSKVLRFVRTSRDAGRASLEEVLLRHACGEDVRPFEREPGAAGVMMIPIPRRGVLRRVDGLADARDVTSVDEVHISAKPGQLLEPLPEGGSYLGFIFARADRAGVVTDALQQAHARLRFVIDTAIPVTGG